MGRPAGLFGRDAEFRAIVSRCTDGRGTLLSGPAGIGKSHLVGGVAEHLAAAGWVVERIVGSRASRDIPLSSFRSLLGDAVPSDRGALLFRVTSTLRERAASGPLLLAVDDVNLVDALSLEVVVQLSTAGVAVPLVAARSERGLPEAAIDLWTVDVLERVDLGPLTVTAIGQLTAATVGAPCSAGLVTAVHEASGGNPLLARELVRDAVAGEAVVLRDGVWSLDGPLQGGERMQDLVAARVAALGAEAQSIAELISIAEPVPLAYLDHDARATVERLEHEQVVHAREEDGRLLLSMAHPLFGDALAASLTAVGRVRLIRGLVRRAEEVGLEHPGDGLRVLAWTAAIGEEVSPPLAVAAGREALAGFDLALAVELTEPVAVAVDDAEAHIVLGEALRLAGRTAESEHHLERALVLATDEGRICSAALSLAALHTFVHGDPARGIALLADVVDAVDDDARELELRSEMALMATLTGRFEDVLTLSSRILDRPAIDDRLLWETLVNLTYAEVMLGRVTHVRDQVARALRVSHVVRAERPAGIDLMLGLDVGAQLLLGDLGGAADGVLDRLEETRSTELHRGIHATVGCQLLLYASRREAVDVGREAVEQLTAVDAFAARPMAIGSLGLALADTGNVDEAADVVAGAQDAVGWVVSWVDRARAAVLAARGERAAAAELAAAAGREALANSLTMYGVLALHDAVRHGGAVGVAGELRSAAAGLDADLVELLVRHAEAAAGQDHEELDAVATEFLRHGATQVAAESWVQASELAAMDLPVRARRLAFRARLAADRAAPFVPRRLPDVPDQLTDREVQVGVAAAAGRSSRSIAERLFVSPRTVDNHLRRVYAKLEVDGRGDLAEAIGPVALLLDVGVD